MHELQYVSGHELYMRRLVLMGPCAGGVFGEAQRHAPCVGSGRFAPENRPGLRAGGTAWATQHRLTLVCTCGVRL